MINLPWQKRKTESAPEEPSTAEREEQPTKDETNPDTIRRCVNANCRKPLSNKSKYNECEECRQKKADILRDILAAAGVFSLGAFLTYINSRATKHSE